MKNYKIMTLGASGAGKTVFLASMFKELSIQGKHGFYLEVEAKQNEKLLDYIYSKIVTGDDWPQGTRFGEVSEWTFTCRVQTPNLNNYSACQFTYFDYAGGRLTDVEEDEELEELVKQTDVILGLLDGQKLYSLMKDNNQTNTDNFLKKDLPSLLKWMHSCRVPIHFVITKWDLIEQEFSLEQVREHLLTIPEFEKFIRNRKDRGSLIRLIPVSSVGSNFATPQADGSMKKTGETPCPFLLEVPIACVVPDLFKAGLSELINQQHKLERRNILSNLGRWIKPMLNIGFVILGFADLGLVTYLLEILLDSMGLLGQEQEEATAKRSKGLRQKRDTSIKQVKNEQTALRHSLNSFLCIQNKFGIDFPKSDLRLS